MFLKQRCFFSSGKHPSIKLLADAAAAAAERGIGPEYRYLKVLLVCLRSSLYTSVTSLSQVVPALQQW